MAGINGTNGKCTKYDCRCKHRCEWKNDECIHCHLSTSFSFFLIISMINITLMTSKTLTVELHANAKTDMNSLSALVKMCQFRPELTSIIVSGVIAQIEFTKKQKAITTTEGSVKKIAPLKA